MDYASISLKGCASLLIVTICYKLYKMKIRTHSACCGEHIEIDTSNDGGKDIEIGGV